MRQVNKKIKLVFYRTLFSQSGASLTMGSIASFLRKYGYMVDLCFLEKNDLHAVEKILKDRGKYNIIIAKPNFKDFKELFNIVSSLKKNKIVNFVFFCGPYACLNAEGLMKDNRWLDGVITGAIEETSLDLIKSLNKDCSSFNSQCLGGVWRDPLTKNININKNRDALIPLNELPFPSRDIEIKENVGYVNIEASRGCNFSCTFCHNPIMVKFNNKKGVVDIRDSKLVVDEMEYLHKKIRKSLFIFNDDCFWRGPIDDERILKFCKEIKKRKLDLKFYIYLRCKPFIGDKILKELVRVGLARVFLGIESASGVSQSTFNKPIENDLYFKIKKKLDRYNVNIHIGYIVFEPYSTLKDIWVNIDYLFKMGKLFRLGTILEPVRVVPNSDLHIKLLNDGLISKKLKYDEITYGYKFKHLEVEKLLGKLKNIFNNDLSLATREYEYYCTTAKLIEILIKREGGKYKSVFENDFEDFNKTMDKSMILLRKYFKDMIFSDVDFDHNFLNKKFINNFELVSREIKIKYADIVTKIIERGGSNIIREIYTGLDRI